MKETARGKKGRKAEETLSFKKTLERKEKEPVKSPEKEWAEG